MNSYQALIIAAEDAGTTQLRQLLRGGKPVLSAQMASPDLPSEELGTLLDSLRPDVVFLSVEGISSALPIISLIRRVSRGSQIIAMSRWAAGPELLSLMRLGVREWLELPLDPSALAEAMDRMQEELAASSEPPSAAGDIVAFLPSKAGVGTSTVAMHAAHECARALGKRVALIDLDLNCGIQAFMAKKTPEISIDEIAQYAGSLDDSLWARMAVQTGEVDLLPAGALRPGARIELEDLQQILAFAARRYPLTIVDLSGNWERYSLEAMAQANRILLVTTTDFSALYHSRRNLDTLQEMGMGDKVRVVLNRTTYHTGLDKKAVESILGATPVVSLPNAYHALQEALKDATTVKQRSPFGQGIERLRPEILPASALVVPEGCAASNGRAPSGRFSAIRSVMAGLGSKCLDIQSLDLG